MIFGFSRDDLVLKHLLANCCMVCFQKFIRPIANNFLVDMTFILSAKRSLRKLKVIYLLSFLSHTSIHVPQITPVHWTQTPAKREQNKMKTTRVRLWSGSRQTRNPSTSGSTAWSELEKRRCTNWRTGSMGEFNKHFFYTQAKRHKQDQVPQVVTKHTINNVARLSVI